ncbi:hypothetical protein [Achromobacter sp. SLBN-14]|uniref:hypothetical protein n=1 Tax=Achromobacter sp. SLBN-14 TaxID=2768442 RepID=UPI0015750C06|nr:hypothetical protein [Achromobacter sp. SLBN-14]
MSVAVLATVGKLIDEWATVLWLASLGGRFWGAVSVGIICVAFTAWAGLRGLIATQIAGTAIFIVANIGLSGSYDSFSELNIYHQIAVVAMRGTLFVTVAFVFCVLVLIEGGED